MFTLAPPDTPFKIQITNASGISGWYRTTPLLVDPHTHEDGAGNEIG